MGEELKRLLRSGFVRDTLFPIAGEPNNVRSFSKKEMQILPSGIRGQFNPREDEVQINSTRSIPEMRKTLTHEMGHRFARKKVLPKARSQTLSPELQQLLAGVGQGRRKVEGREALPQGVQHSLSNEDEYFATAFQQALEALRIPAGTRRDSAVAEAEERIPGTRAMVNLLSDLEPFQE